MNIHELTAGMWKTNRKNVAKVGGKLYAETVLFCQDYDGDECNCYCIFPIHKLKDGRLVAITSDHNFSFSDGTEFNYVPIDWEGSASISFIKALEIKKELVKVDGEPSASQTKLSLSHDSMDILEQIASTADIVLVSRILIDALYQMGIRKQYRNVLAQNNTPETSGRNVKGVVDIYNWAY